MKQIFNHPDQKQVRRKLRSEMPKAELILWGHLRSKNLSGYKFRRQYSIKGYIVDFFCPAVKLAIEVDGDSHFTKVAKYKDAIRQRTLQDLGIHF